MDSRDDKAADVKSSDADAEGDNEDDKPMDDSPTSNDDDAEESTSTTQNADTKSSGKIYVMKQCSPSLCSWNCPWNLHKND